MAEERGRGEAADATAVKMVNGGAENRAAESPQNGDRSEYGLTLQTEQFSQKPLERMNGVSSPARNMMRCLRRMPS